MTQQGWERIGVLKFQNPPTVSCRNTLPDPHPKLQQNNHHINYNAATKMTASSAPPETIAMRRGFNMSDTTVIKWIQAQPPESFYLTSEGRVHYTLDDIEAGKTIHFHLRLRGGKGGG